jgi:PAS domain S-box-containing protein
MPPDHATAAGLETGIALAAVLDASPNAIVAVDAAGTIVYANPQVAQTFGYAADEVLGRPIELLLPDRVRDRHLGHRAGFLAHPTARPMGIGLDLAGRRRDGTEVPVEISLSPVETDLGLQVFATIVDISARKAAEAELLQAQKLESLGRLAGGIAHDFNNMVFAIRGYAEMLTEDLAPEVRERFDFEAAERAVRAISDAADRAGTLTAQLLAFSRRQVVSPEVLDPNATIVELEPLLRRLIGENITLVLRLHDSTGRLRADPGQLDQILVNLAVNARDAMPAGGTVTIETGNVEFDEPYASSHFDVSPGPYVMIAVSDTGIGMDQETRDHIFEPFFTTKQVGKGTGLGLATIYGIVRQAGGHIWLYSEPGHGTTFKLYFPRVDAEATTVRDTAASGTAARTGTILVVEDEAAVREMTTMLLERAGHRVIAVDSAGEALARLADGRDPIDLLVSDVIMPGMSGVELAERALDEHPGLGVVLLSGYTAETLGLERITSRGASFVPKPVTSRQLLEAVQTAFGRRRPG